MGTKALYRASACFLPLLVLGLGACGGGDGDLASDSAAVREAAERLAQREEAREAPASDAAGADRTEATSGAAGTSREARSGSASGGAPRTQAAESTPTGGAASEPAPEPELATVPAGTAFSAALGRELSTGSAAVGDTFTASLGSPLSADGRSVVPAGATLHGEVTAVQKSGGTGETAVLKLNFSRISFAGDSYPVAASIIQAHPESKSRTTTGEAAGRIGGGAAAGAILGRIIGGDTKGAVIGAAVGAAAGTAVVLGTQDVDAVLPAGSTLELRLDEPLVVKATP